MRTKSGVLALVSTVLYIRSFRNVLYVQFRTSHSPHKNLFISTLIRSPFEKKKWKRVISLWTRNGSLMFTPTPIDLLIELMGNEEFLYKLQSANFIPRTRHFCCLRSLKKLIDFWNSQLWPRFVFKGVPFQMFPYNHHLN